MSNISADVFAHFREEEPFFHDRVLTMSGVNSDISVSPR